MGIFSGLKSIFNAWNSIKPYEDGVKYLNKGNYEMAILKFNEAIKLCPDYEQAWNALGMAYMYLANPQKALFCFEKAIEICKNYADAWYNKGEALCALGDFAGGQICKEIAEKIDQGWYLKE